VALRNLMEDIKFIVFFNKKIIGSFSKFWCLTKILETGKWFSIKLIIAYKQIMSLVAWWLRMCKRADKLRD